jgi:hypothetical protein
MCLTAPLLIPRAACAQSRNEAAVRAVVDSFFASMAREQWDSAAALIDLHAFEPFFRQQVSYSRRQLPMPEPTMEELMAHDSTMPRASGRMAARPNEEGARRSRVRRLLL